MTEQKNSSELSASLSAMFDGEATDKDIEQLLNANSLELNEQLEGYQLIRSALQGEKALSLNSGASFFESVSQAIEAEQLSEEKNSTVGDGKVVPILAARGSEEKPKNTPLKTIFSSLAIAASVSFVVIFGGNTLFSPLEGGVGVSNTVAVESAGGLEDPVSLAELEHQDTMPADNIRLQHYLRKHAEQSTMNVGQGMIPMARVVSYPVEE